MGTRCTGLQFPLLRQCARAVLFRIHGSSLRLYPKWNAVGLLGALISMHVKHGCFDPRPAIRPGDHMTLIIDRRPLTHGLPLPSIELTQIKISR